MAGKFPCSDDSRMATSRSRRATRGGVRGAAVKGRLWGGSSPARSPPLQRRTARLSLLLALASIAFEPNPSARAALCAKRWPVARTHRRYHLPATRSLRPATDMRPPTPRAATRSLIQVRACGPARAPDRPRRFPLGGR